VQPSSRSSPERKLGEDRGRRESAHEVRRNLGRRRDRRGPGQDTARHGAGSPDHRRVHCAPDAAPLSRRRRCTWSWRSTPCHCGADELRAWRARQARDWAVRAVHGDGEPSFQQPHAPMSGNLTAARMAPRCGARRKKDHQPCQAPAMPNGRCRMHGGPSPGAPKGERNGNYRHGLRTQAAMAERRDFGNYFGSWSTQLLVPSCHTSSPGDSSRP
jgi:hypothetical protein